MTQSAPVSYNQGFSIQKQKTKNLTISHRNEIENLINNKHTHFVNAIDPSDEYRCIEHCNDENFEFNLQISLEIVSSVIEDRFHCVYLRQTMLIYAGK